MKRKLTIFIYFMLHLEIRHLQLTRRWHVGDRFFFFWTAQVKSPLIECAHCSRLHLNGDFCRGDTWPGICLTVMPGLAMLSVCVPESSSRFPPVDCFWLTRLTRARTNTRALTHTHNQKQSLTFQSPITLLVLMIRAGGWRQPLWCLSDTTRPAAAALSSILGRLLWALRAGLP